MTDIKISLENKRIFTTSFIIFIQLLSNIVHTNPVLTQGLIGIAEFIYLEEAITNNAKPRCHRIILYGYGNVLHELSVYINRNLCFFKNQSQERPSLFWHRENGGCRTRIKNKIRLYDMPIQLYIKDKYSFMSSFVSKTIAPMYLLIVLILVASCIILECNGFKYF